MKVLSSIRFIVVVLVLGVVVRAAGQEMPGIANSVFTCGESANLNPSLPVMSPYYLDINAVSVSLFAENNYIYIKKDENKLRRFFGPAPIESAEPIGGSGGWYSDYNVPGLKSGFMNVRITGPSVSLVLGPHAFGISFNVRSVTSVRNIPAPLAKFLYEGMYFPGLHDKRFVHEEKMSAASLAWGELAFNYSGIFSVRNKNVWSGGISVKTLSGLGGISVYSDHLDYMVAGYDTLKVFSADADIRLAAPINFDNNAYEGGIKGWGLGFDAGITFERKKLPVGWLSTYNRPCTQLYVPYLYRIGISLLDMGRIDFSANAMQITLKNDSLYWPGIRSLGNTSINRVTDTLSNRIFGNTTQLVSANSTSIGLPASLCLHGDYNFYSKWYASAIIILPVNTNSHSSVIRPSVFTGGIRYETKNSSAGFTATLQGIHGIETSSLHTLTVGFHARYKSIYIGTGNIISFLKINDYTGSDLYAGIRLTFNKGRCKRTGFRCPDFF